MIQDAALTVYFTTDLRKHVAEEGTALHKVAILTAVVVLLLPVEQADVAELVSAAAGHVVAAFRLLDEHAAAGTPLPLLEAVLEVGVAWSLVGLRHTFLAEERTAGLAGRGNVGFDGSLTVLGGAEAQVLPVLLFVVLRDVLEAAAAGVDAQGAVLLRAGDFLEDGIL